MPMRAGTLKRASPAIQLQPHVLTLSGQAAFSLPPSASPAQPAANSGWREKAGGGRRKAPRRTLPLPFSAAPRASAAPSNPVTMGSCRPFRFRLSEGEEEGDGDEEDGEGAFAGVPVVDDDAVGHVGPVEEGELRGGEDGGGRGGLGAAVPAQLLLRQAHEDVRLSNILPFLLPPCGAEGEGKR